MKPLERYPYRRGVHQERFHSIIFERNRFFYIFIAICITLRRMKFSSFCGCCFITISVVPLQGNNCFGKNVSTYTSKYASIFRFSRLPLDKVISSDTQCTHTRHSPIPFCTPRVTTKKN